MPRTALALVVLSEDVADQRDNRLDSVEVLRRCRSAVPNAACRMGARCGLAKPEDRPHTGEQSSYRTLPKCAGSSPPQRPHSRLDLPLR